MDSMEATIRHIAEDGNEHLVGYHPFHIAQGPDCFPIEISEGFFFFFENPLTLIFQKCHNVSESDFLLLQTIILRTTKDSTFPASYRQIHQQSAMIDKIKIDTYKNT